MFTDIVCVHADLFNHVMARIAVSETQVWAIRQAELASFTRVHLVCGVAKLTR